MNEDKIKSLTIAKLLTYGMISKGDIIASEFSLGYLDRRVDLAVLSSSLIGIEIKSENDSLRRLSEQLRSYVKVFDQTVVICAEKHISKVLECAPGEVNIWSISTDGEIAQVRQALISPHHNSSDLAQILTVAELKRILKLPLGFRSSRSNLVDLAGDLSVRISEDGVHQAFRNRFASTSDSFWKNYDKSNTAIENLRPLSRFRNRRDSFALFKSDQKNFWETWSTQFEVDL